MAAVIIGFDPGGKSGVAIGELDSGFTRISCATVGSVSEALDWFSSRLQGRVPIAVGVDSFLSWSVVKGGWRKVDNALRRKYPEVKSSVICSNSTYGSMAVQGMCLAIEASRRWPKIVLNEVHPKVLWRALTVEMPYPRIWFSQGPAACTWLQDSGVQFDVAPANDHELDAALAVWITGRGLEEGLFDFVNASLGAGETLVLPAGEVKYFWPTEVLLS